MYSCEKRISHSSTMEPAFIQEEEARPTHISIDTSKEESRPTPSPTSISWKWNRYNDYSCSMHLEAIREWSARMDEWRGWQYTNGEVERGSSWSNRECAAFFRIREWLYFVLECGGFVSKAMYSSKATNRRYRRLLFANPAVLHNHQHKSRKKAVHLL